MPTRYAHLVRARARRRDEASSTTAAQSKRDDPRLRPTPSKPRLSYEQMLLRDCGLGPRGGAYNIRAFVPIS